MKKTFILFLLLLFLLISCTPQKQIEAEENMPDYSFPEVIDPSRQYLFYLHGRIIEDQGIPAISPDFGEYQYYDILESFREHNFVVISEQREANTVAVAYAQKVSEQVEELMETGIPAENITLVGASKGSYIAIFASRFLKEREINIVLLGSCSPGEVQNLIQNKIHLYGNILSIYDSVDPISGSCKDLFAFSEEKGIGNYNEIVLDVGTGHGILYQPLDEWILPTVAWAKQN